MSSKMMRLLLIGALGLTAVAFIVITLGSFSMLSRQSQKLVDLKLQNHTAETQLSLLPEAKKQVDQYGYFNDVAKTVLPSDKNQAQAVSDIYEMAGDSGIAIQDLTFPASTLGSSSASGTSAATTPTKAVISQAAPVTGINGLYSIPLTITPQTGAKVPADKKVTYAKFLTFLQHIEKNRRTAQITKVDVTPADNGDFNFVITVNLFIKP
jgi:hypothetical protein